MKTRSFAVIALLSASAAAALPGADEAPAVGSAPPRQTLSASALPQSVTDVDRALEKLDREARAARKELEDLARESREVHARSIARGRAYVRMARAGLLPVGGGFQELVDYAARLERVRRALARDLDREEEIARRRVTLGKRLDAISAERGPLQLQEQAMQQAKNALLAEQDRARAFERAFDSSGPMSHTAVYGAGTGPGDPSELVTGFAAMKGRLPFPLAGRSEIASAYRNGGDGPGLEMRAPRGAPVRAVFGGTVAFADTYADYGKTVILDHGGSYYTVSANLDDIAVKVGDDVSAGTRIGTVGDSGRGALLYFEIRKGADTLPPSAWFGI